MVDWQARLSDGYIDDGGVAARAAMEAMATAWLPLASADCSVPPANRTNC
eukprot:SAG31_NODE_12056_length_973_cov_0.869565_1_plen_49_part_10